MGDREEEVGGGIGWESFGLLVRRYVRVKGRGGEVEYFLYLFSSIFFVVVENVRFCVFSVFNFVNLGYCFIGD